MREWPRYQIILLPRTDYWSWVDSVRDYAVHFGASLTPHPENALEFHNPQQTITVINSPGGFLEQGDIVAWLRGQAPSVQLDVVSVDDPDHLLQMLALRIASGEPLGDQYGLQGTGVVISDFSSDGLKSSTVSEFSLQWPTDFPAITQAFGENPDLYRKWGLPGHEGIDFRAPTNSNVYACASGEVSQVSDGSRHHPYGIHVRIKHSGGYQTIYAHLNKALVTNGAKVNAGEIIALADSTGNSSGSHLHLTLKREGATAAGLTNYPHDIVDPTPYLLAPASRAAFSGPEWPYGRCLVGVHGRADGPMEDSDWAMIKIAQIEALKLTSASAPEDVDRALQINPKMFILARLRQDFRTKLLSPSDFVRWVESDAQALYERGVKYFEIHTEPNTASEGWGISWRDGREFGDWFLQVIGQLRVKLPDAKFGWPGLSPGAGVEGQRMDDNVFLDEAADAIKHADWLGCHCHWQTDDELLSAGGGLGYQHYQNHYPEKLVFITEFSNPSPVVPAETKGWQYVRYYQLLRSQLGLGAAFAFALSASAGYTGEAWRSETGQITSIPMTIGQRSD